jgi:hypothetical protein
MVDFDPETAGNSEEIEMQFAVKTVEHLEVSHLAYLRCILYCELIGVGIREAARIHTAKQDEAHPVSLISLLYIACASHIARLIAEHTVSMMKSTLIS